MGVWVVIHRTRCAPDRHKELKSWIIEHQELTSTWQMCRAAFTTEVFDFTANSVLGLRIMPELQCLKKKRKEKRRQGRISASTRKNIYISEKWKCTPIHKSANPTNKDWRFLCICLWLTDYFFLYIFLFTWMCTRFVQNIAALFSLSLKLHYLPLFLWKSGILYCGHLNKELN